MENERKRRRRLHKRNRHRRDSDFRKVQFSQDEEFLLQAERRKRRAIEEALEELTAEELAGTADEF